MSTGWFNHKIRPEDADHVFRKIGYERAWLDASVNEISYYRQVHPDELFGRIIVSGAGKRGEAVAADLDVAVVRGRTGTKGLVRRELLFDVATDKRRGHTIIANSSEGRDWLEAVAATCSEKLSALVEREGLDLLELRRPILRACRKYIELTEFKPTLSETCLSMRSDPQLAMEGERISEWPGVVWVPGGEEAYSVAAMILVKHNGEVDPDLDFAQMNPFEDKELFMRLQVLTDYLIYDVYPDSPH